MLCWVNRGVNAVQTFFSIGSSVETSNTYNRVSLRQSSGSQLQYQVSDPSATSLMGASNTSTGIWYGLCGTSRAANDHQVRDSIGGNNTSTTSHTPSGLDQIAIGCHWRSVTSQGTDPTTILAFCALWNTGMVAGEMDALLDGLPPWHMKPGNLVACWPLFGDSDADEKNWWSGDYLMSEQGTVTVGATNPPISLPFPWMRGGYYYAPAALTNYNITASHTTYAQSGQAANLLFDQIVGAAQGTYTLSGQSASLLANRLVGAALGTYALTGQDIAAFRGYFISSETGSFTLSGQNAEFIYHHILSAAKGDIALAGQAAAMALGTIASAGYGSYTSSGVRAGLWKKIAPGAESYSPVSAGSNSWTPVAGGSNDYDEA